MSKEPGALHDIGILSQFRQKSINDGSVYWFQIVHDGLGQPLNIGYERMTIFVDLSFLVDLQGDRRTGTDEHSNTLSALRKNLPQIDHKAVRIVDRSLRLAYPVNTLTHNM